MPRLFVPITLSGVALGLAVVPGVAHQMPRVDRLTLASGVVLVSAEGDYGSGTASTGLRTIDGAPEQIGVTRDAAAPTVYVYELPATTTFDLFAVPDVMDGPGNATFFGAMKVEGSSESAETGFDVLVDAQFAEADEGGDTLVEFRPAVAMPVRWIRLTLSGALRVEPEHGTGRTVVRFSELIGNGTQEEVPLSEGFDGIWEFRFADSPHLAGPLLELHQRGATVEGCYGDVVMTGTVAGRVARLTGIDSSERPSAYLFVTTSDGELRGVESTNRGVFRARVGPVAPEGSETACSGREPELLACGSIAYVNFDFDSAEIRPESAQVLEDLYRGLSTVGEGRIMIEGHTSTEGTGEHNLDLSERRARAVMDALIAKGFPRDRISAVGKGEAEPLVSEADEASRAINRRVEIACDAT